MANVILRSDSGKAIVDLPSVCMKCGAPATVRATKTFSWCPSWVGILFLVGLLPYMVVSSMLTKRQTVQTPLCSRHENYWWVFPLTLVLTFVGLLGLGFIDLYTMDKHYEQNGQWRGLLFVATLLGMLVVVFVGLIGSSMRVRPAEITDRYIRLTSVSAKFADAVEAHESRRRSAFGRMDGNSGEPRWRYQNDDRYTR